MISRSQVLAAIVVLAAGAVVFSAWQLLRTRYEVGNAHPPYSSLRTDPLGTRALHDALEALPGRDSRRLYQTRVAVDAPHRTALLVLGVHPAETAAMDEALVRQLEDCARGGGRVIIALLPTAREDWNTRRLEQRARSGALPWDDSPPVSLRTKWGFEIKYDELPTQDDGTVEPLNAVPAPEFADALPERVPWHSGVRLTDLGETWETILSVDAVAVLVARRMGAGSVILSTDAYPFSNESLRTARQTRLLEWYLGGCERIAFEETHLGLNRTVGIAGLANRYRLHGFFAGGVLLALLAIWSCTSRLVPRQTSVRHTSSIQGLDSISGLANLIRRSVPESDLPRVCFEEWQNNASTEDPRFTSLLATLSGIVQNHQSLPRHQRDTVGAVEQMFAAAAAHQRPLVSARGTSSSSRPSAASQTRLNDRASSISKQRLAG